MRAAASFSFTGRHSASTAEIGVPSAAHGPSPQSLHCRIVRNRAVLENHHHLSPNASSSATTLEQQPAFGANHVGTGGRYTRYQRFAHAGRNSALHAPAERPNHSFLLYASYEAFCSIFCHYSPNDQLHQSSCSVTKVSDLSVHRSRAGTPSLYAARSAPSFVQVSEAPRVR